MAQLKTGMETPDDVMKLIKLTLDLSAIFIPHMAIVSVAFGLFGSVIGETKVKEFSEDTKAILNGIEKLRN